MRVCAVNTSDTNGGAARAAYRLHTGIRSLGVDSSLLVQSKICDDPSVTAYYKSSLSYIPRIRLLLDQLPVMRYQNRSGSVIAPSWVPSKLWQHTQILNSDIVHIHWITKAFIRIEELCKFQKPIIWTLHDMWAFTGGCHYDMECGKYLQTCGACPMLGSSNEADLSSRIFSRKASTWRKLNLTIVTPSNWLAGLAKRSTLLSNHHIEVIPNGIDLQLYQPVDKRSARNRFNLPLDKQIILFGAMSATSDKRKGFDKLKIALSTFVKNHQNNNIMIVVFGNNDSKDVIDLGLPAKYTGNIKSEHDLISLYSAADVFVAPSLQDNLPNTIMEAMACGTPVVSFNIGGAPDMIEHRTNGYLAKSFDTEDFAKGIYWILEDQDRWQQLSNNARSKIMHTFDISLISNKYLSLYERILTNSVNCGLEN